MGEIVKRFSFFRSYFLAAETLPNDEEKLAYYDYIMHFAFEGVVPEMVRRPAYSSFINALPNIEESITKIRNAEENGKKGGAPKGNQNARKYPKEETTNGLISNQTDKDREEDKDKEMNNGESNRTIHKENDDGTGRPDINFDKLYS